MKVLLTFLPVRSPLLSVVMGSRSLKGLNDYPPMSIYLLGAILSDNGYETVLLDPTWYIDHRREEILSHLGNVLNEIDVVAVSTNSINWAETKQFIEAVHELNPDIPIVLGGVHATYFDHYVLKTTPVDLVVRGEGDKTFLKLLGLLERGSREPENIAGISYRDRDGNYRRNPDAPLLSEEEYRKLPMPLLDQVPPNRYYAPLLESSRGCLFSCTFCGIMYHKSWRALTAEQTLERFERTLEMSKGRFIRPDFVLFTDDCFTASQNRTTQILRGIATRYPKVRFNLEGRLSDLQSDEVMSAIPYDQIHRFLVGVEAGYNEALRSIRKGLTVEKVKSVLAGIGRSGVARVLQCSFIIGFPWETEEDCLKTIRFAADLVEEYNVQCRLSWHAIVPSVIWEERKKYGVNHDESLFDRPNWFFTPALSRDAEEVFYSLHPYIDEDAYWRIEERIKMYCAMGIRLSDYVG